MKKNIILEDMADIHRWEDQHIEFSFSDYIVPILKAFNLKEGSKIRITLEIHSKDIHSAEYQE